MKLSRQIVALLGLIACSALSQATTELSEQDYYLYPGDFNGDGRTDLLYIGKTPDKPNGIALADANGVPQMGFQSWSATYLGIPWSTGQFIPVIGDFNGDGKSDVLMQAVGTGTTSYVLLANTNTDYGAVGQLIGISQAIQPTLFGIAWAASEHQILVGDFDGDGKDDVLLQATTKGGTNAIVLTASNGTLFTRSSSYCWSGGPQQCWTDGEQGLDWSTKSAVLTVGKFNADARADLLYQPRPNIVLIDYEIPIPVPVFKANTFGLFLGQVPDGSGRIIRTANQLWSNNDLGATWSPLNSLALVGDFNGDGYDDVLLQSKNGTNKLLYANSAGVLGTAVTPASNVAAWSGSAYHAIVGKFGNSSRAVLYLQAKTAGGDNYYTSDISAGTVSAYSSPLQFVANFPAPPSAIGATPATADVTQNGSAAYTIPIQLPPGTAGLTPSLSLTYSSAAGNGLLGVGWSLSGLGIITRCAQTFAQDGLVQDVQLLSTDQYCLNGSRLRLTSGTQGAPGSTYRTELETYALVIAGPAGTQGPLSFTVKTKEGLIYEYGGTSDSRIGVPGNTSITRTWALSKVSDRAISATTGNYWSVTYVNDAAGTGAYWPDSIDYTTSMLASPAAAPYRVKFTYGSRNTGENLISYYHGGRINQTKRLTSVELQTSGGAALIRKYSLQYQVPPSTFSVVSRLESVQECSQSGACMAPTTFTWSDTPLAAGAPELGPATADHGYMNQSETYEIPGAVAYWPDTVYVWKSYPLDINGDGIPDVVQFYQETSGIPTVITESYTLFIGTSTGQYQVAVSGSPPTPNGSPPNGVDDLDEDGKDDLFVRSMYLHQRTDGTYAFDPAPAGTGYLGSVDVNGDGYADSVSPYIEPNNVSHLSLRLHKTDGTYGYESTASNAWSAPPSTPIMGDQFWVGGTSIPPRYRQAIAYADVDGDGRQDLLVMLTSGWRVMYSNGTGFTAGQAIVSTAAYNGAKGAVSSYFPPVPIDVNGDGCTDFAYAKPNGTQNYWYLAISTCRSDGTGLILDVPTNIPVTGMYLDLWHDDWGTASAADINGDGNMDLVSGSVVLLSDGITLKTLTAWTGGGSSAGEFQFWADRNGDGVPDFVSRSSYGDQYRPGKGQRPNYLLSATDGFGKSIRFDYAPMTDASVYTRGSGTSGRTRDIQNAMYVVKTMTLSDGIGGRYSQTYTYAGGKRNIRGRGFLGFASREVTDSRTGFVTREVYNNTVLPDDTLWEYVGTLASRTTYQYKNSNGTFGPKVEELTQNWQAILPDAAPNRRYPYVYQAVTQRFELSGANYLTTTQTTSIDNYGTPWDVTTTTVDAANPSLSSTVETKTPTTDILNDTVNWCIARPKRIEDHRSHTLNLTDGAQITRVSTAVWDAARCRITHKTDAPGSGYQLDTDISYDSFNNVSQTSVTGDNVNHQPLITQWNYGGNGHLLQSMKNAKGHVTAYGWSVPYAFKTSQTVKLSTTDPNGVTTSWVPDDFGREKQMTRPDQTRTFKKYYNCLSSNSYCGDTLLRYVVRTEERNTSDAMINYTDQFFDALGRVKYEQSLGFNGQTVVTETLYDERGNVALKTHPHFAGSGSVSGLSMSYDVLGRLTQTRHPVSDADRSIVSEYVMYDGLTTSQIDANGRYSSSLANVLGTVAKATDTAGKDTLYRYNGFGELLATTDPLGNVSSLHYIAARGFKDFMDDPDMGHWTYTYDALGQMLTQTDAKSQTTTFAYDELGRTEKRIDHGGGTANTTQWNWDNAASGYGVGQLASVTSPGGYSQTYAYDSKRRRTQMTTVANGTSFVVDSTYDVSTGKLDTVTYPSSTGTRLTVKYGYQYGFAKDVRDAATGGTVLWQATAQDARGHVTQEQYGNGQVTTLGFDQTNGRLNTIQTGAGAATQNLIYGWDAVGNLGYRRDVNQGLTETFTYDALYRVTSIQRNADPQVTLSYDDIGNILSKSGPGAYVYSGAQTGCNYSGLTAQPHAVRKVGSSVYCSDANGNMVSRSGATVSWSSYNYPLTINQAGSSNASTFYYGADRNRYRQVSVDSGVTEDRITVAGGAFERLIRTGGSAGTEYRHFIQIAGKAVALVKRSAQTGNSTFYLHEDHLGSTDVITQDNPSPANQIVARMSFDAWGQRRGSNWTGTPSTSEKAAISATTHQGFTGQEQLDNLNLVHLNGRVYDPVIGRFMSADPIVQDPYHSQSFNRYAYVWNNPLNGTDPTGFVCTDDPPTGSHIRQCTQASNAEVIVAPNDVRDNGSDQGRTAAVAAPDVRNDRSKQTTAGDAEATKPNPAAGEAPKGDDLSRFERFIGEPFVTVGRNFAALFAYAFGDKALREVALDVMRESVPANKELAASMLLMTRGGTAKGVPTEGLAFELKYLDRHIEGTAQANRMLSKAEAVHVFDSKTTAGDVAQAIIERGEFTGTRGGFDRYGLQFESPIGYRIAPDGGRVPLTYGQLKVRPDGMYHVIPRTGAGQ
jgi:RHS repeat-associated protein